MRRRVGVLGGLLIVALLLVPPSGERLPALTVYSADPAGGKALQLWLDRIGYATATLEDGEYQVPEGTGTLLVLAPSLPVTTFQADTLERWVRDGGRLVVVAESRAADTILGRFGLDVAPLPVVAETAAPLATGSLGRGACSPADGTLDPAIGAVTVRAASALELKSDDAIPILGDGERVFGARARAGSGELLALSAPHALSNEALRGEANARLALSLVGPPTRGTVMFDELHHGYGAVRSRPLFALLVDHAWGRAALLAGMIAFAYLALSGRRFGRARPVVVTRGRSLGEYVASLAGLYRAGGKRGFAAAHFERRLRREVTQAVGLPGDATDAQIDQRARTLGRDPTDALAVLRTLRTQTAPREAELLRLVRDGERARTSLSTRAQPRPGMTREMDA